MSKRFVWERGRSNRRNQTQWLSLLVCWLYVLQNVTPVPCPLYLMDSATSQHSQHYCNWPTCALNFQGGFRPNISRSSRFVPDCPPRQRTKSSKEDFPGNKWNCSFRCRQLNKPALKSLELSTSTGAPHAKQMGNFAVLQSSSRHAYGAWCTVCAQAILFCWSRDPKFLHDHMHIQAAPPTDNSTVRITKLLERSSLFPSLHKSRLQLSLRHSCGVVAIVVVALLLRLLLILLLGQLGVV